MWASWVANNYRRKEPHIVVSHDRAKYGDNYAAEIKARDEEQRQRKIRDAMTPNRIADLQSRRAKARAEKDYALADALRDELVAAGVTVADAKIVTLTDEM